MDCGELAQYNSWELHFFKGFKIILLRVWNVVETAIIYTRAYVLALNLPASIFPYLFLHLIKCFFCSWMESVLSKSPIFISSVTS